ncbi:MAG TPA: hypothetical protein PLU64_02700, partial [Saprospiraceae bacterium]|nr:hypothetical protein [Saprospiraceae bacterium]
TIVIYNLKRSSIQPKSLRKRLARRFSVINDESNFSVVVNGEPITLLDRDYFRNIQFLWPIGKPDVSQLRTFQNIYLMEPLGGTLEYSSSKAGIKVEQRYSYSGWIGTVEKPSQLNEEGTNNNKISIICRGKMAQEDVLETFPEGGIYADYLIGEITADFLDDTKEEDIATSSRQKFNEDDKRFSELRSAIYRHLKTVQSKWTKARTEGATEKVLGEFPAVKEWYDALVSDSHKTHAQKLFRTIGTLRFDDGEDEKKRTLIRSSMLAFEKLKIRENLSLIDRINTADDIELISVFSELSDLEALQYYDIASNRLKVIRELKGKIQNNDLEKVLQKHIFDNLWLLNPSWERATQASEYMEQKIGTLFSEISDKLPREQREGRIDIGYRTAGGKHIIVELKRYRPSYKINPFTLAEQIDKYFSALTTCLKNSDPNLNPYIEVICIIGEFDKNYNREKFDAHLSNYNGRVYPYDQLVEEALQSYGQYLSRQQSIGKLKSIIDRI